MLQNGVLQIKEGNIDQNLTFVKSGYEMILREIQIIEN